MIMQVKLLSDNAKLPQRATEQAAGFDLYTPEHIVIKPGRNIVPLDISIAIPFGMEGQIRPRSGFSAKGMEGLPYAGGDAMRIDDTEPTRYDADVLLGTIDSDYRGCVGILVNSHETEPFVIAKGTRIAQLVIAPYAMVDVEKTDALDETKRGQGGFGHTGTK